MAYSPWDPNVGDCFDHTSHDKELSEHPLNNVPREVLLELNI